VRFRDCPRNSESDFRLPILDFGLDATSNPKSKIQNPKSNKSGTLPGLLKFEPDSALGG
jgi:hypothetical protein